MMQIWVCQFTSSNLPVDTSIVSDALIAQQIVEELDLTSGGRQWYVRSASAKTGEGLMDAMKQFAIIVKEFKAKKS